MTSPPTSIWVGRRSPVCELWQRDFSVYTYFDDRIEEARECGELDALCWDDIVYDLDGNMLSRKGSYSAAMAYGFDTRHNWTNRRELRRMGQQPPLEVVETREITYR